jgi:hypothetical protein
MTIRSDLSTLDWKFRAKRTGQSPIEYAAAVEIHKRPPSISAWAVSITLALGFVAAIVAGVVT